MALILNITADNSDSRKVKIRRFKNSSGWTITGSPTYSTTVHPSGWNDSFYFNGSTFLTSPTDAAFNLYRKSFTITWWEYSAGGVSGETGSLDFGLNQYYPQSYLLLSYQTNSTCYASTTSNSGSWGIFDGWSMGGYVANQWINFAFVSDFKNNTHTFRLFRNGSLIGTRTSGSTFPNVGSSGRMYVGAYQGNIGPNRYFQNIKMYDEALFSSNYKVADYEKYGLNSLIYNNLAIEDGLDLEE